ncbi:MAG: hypothetical protein ACKOCI_09150 [Cyanobium sp.]
MTPILTEVSPPGAAAAIQAATTSAYALPAFLQSQVIPIVINLLGALAILLACWLLAGGRGNLPATAAPHPP